MRSDPRRPNLVVKPANAAQAKGIVTGRFEGEAEARRGLGSRDDDAVPNVFRATLLGKLLRRLGPGKARVSIIPSCRPTRSTAGRG